LLTVGSFRESLEIEQAESGRNGLSVYVYPGATVAETCTTAALPHRRIRTSTVGELARGGFNVVPDGPDGHCLVLVDDASAATWARLNALFSAPLINPARGG
jgi:hypothetical protein